MFLSASNYADEFNHHFSLSNLKPNRPFEPRLLRLNGTILKRLLPDQATGRRQVVDRPKPGRTTGLIQSSALMIDAKGALKLPPVFRHCHQGSACVEAREEISHVDRSLDYGLRPLSGLSCVRLLSAAWVNAEGLPPSTQAEFPVSH